MLRKCFGGSIFIRVEQQPHLSSCTAAGEGGVAQKILEKSCSRGNSRAQSDLHSSLKSVAVSGLYPCRGSRCARDIVLMFVGCLPAKDCISGGPEYPVSYRDAARIAEDQDHGYLQAPLL